MQRQLQKRKATPRTCFTAAASWAAALAPSTITPLSPPAPVRTVGPCTSAAVGGMGFDACDWVLLVEEKSARGGRTEPWRGTTAGGVNEPVMRAPVTQSATPPSFAHPSGLSSATFSLPATPPIARLLQSMRSARKR